MPDPFPNERPTFCVTMDCGLRATRYVTCDGEGRHPYCEECADVLIRGGESDLGPVTQPRVPDPFPSELVEAIRVEWRVVEADGQPFPPHSAPLLSRESAERRLTYYESLTRATGEARLPKKPLRIERRSVVTKRWEA